MKQIIITPIKSLNADFQITTRQVGQNLTSNDLWIICLDSSSDTTKYEIEKVASEFIQPNQYKVINSNLRKFAGNTRNSAIDFIKNIPFPYILSFLDADDFIHENYSQIIKKNFLKRQYGIISFSYERHKSGDIKIVKHKDVTLPYEKFIYNYNAGCLATSVFIRNEYDLNAARFGSRKRANDQKYFLDAVRYFGEITYKSDVVATYNINRGSLSHKKYKMPIYKFLALIDHGIPIIKSLHILVYYIVAGVRRHFLGKEI